MPTRTLVGHLKICDGQILWADEDAHALLDYPSGALADMPFDDVLPSAAAAGSPVWAMQIPARGAVDGPQVVLLAQHGRSLLVDMRGERMEDRCVLWSFTLAVRRTRGQRLDLLSRHDALTRLPNRVPSLDELSPPPVRDGKPAQLLAACYLDLDRFRDVNESLGPVGGDAVLREVARRLKAAVPGDASVARVGGDEFALLLFVNSESHCRGLLDQVLARLAHPFRVQDRSTRLRTSVGVALMPYGAQPTEVMLQHAQHATFLAKRAGGSQIRFFDAGQALEEQQELQIRQRVQKGLAAGEFLLAYQPKVDMLCGRVIGFEALVRWRHPERGLLQPAAFVTLIEDHEAVEQLGDWAIGEAVRQAAQWQADGVQTSVSVNISPRHLLRPDFIERLAFHLGRFPQLHAGVLELEILETTAIKDFAAVADFIDACRKLGVPVVMDDFGTGYSSLTYLRQLPVTALKLDQSFVRGMLDDPEDEAIIRGILVMARGLGRKTIAEGVESVAHGDALMALGCTLGQGYGIAKPLPPTDVPAWIAGFERAPPWGRAPGC